MSPRTSPDGSQAFPVLAKWHKHNVLQASLAQASSVTLINDLYLDLNYHLY